MVVQEGRYPNVIMGMNPTNYKNHEAINAIIMAVKKRIYYKDSLKTHDPATITSNIDHRRWSKKDIALKD